MVDSHDSSLNQNAQVRTATPSYLADLAQLVKFRLTMTVVLSAVMAYLIAAPSGFSWMGVGLLALGGFLITAASNAINQVLEREHDALMKRTADRPVAAGRMKPSEAVGFAGICVLAGTTILASFNPWTGLFGMIAFVSYAFLYTPLKRDSPIAITVGAVAGALPMLIGCVALQGGLTWLGAALFGIQFFWQYPHFYAIGWLGFEDYKKAGYRFIPERNGVASPNLGWYSSVLALALLPLVWVPWYLEVTGIVSAVIGTVLTLGYAWFGWRLQQQQDRKAALALMFSSFAYLPGLLAVFFFDKI